MEGIFYLCPSNPPVQWCRNVAHFQMEIIVKINNDAFIKELSIGKHVFIERWESDDKVQGHREYYRILDVDIYICINYCLRI